MKDYYQYFGCVNGCNNAKPAHTNHSSDDCEIVCSVCGDGYASSYEEICDTYFKPEQDGPTCDWNHFFRHTEAMQEFAADKERQRIIEIFENNIMHRTAAAAGQVFVTINPNVIELIKGEQK